MASIDDLRSALSVLEDEGVCMLTTIDERGTLSSRPMTVKATDPDGDVWFVADRHAAWVEPAHGAAANSSVSAGDRWLSFAGRLEVLTNDHTLARFDARGATEHGHTGSEPAALRFVVDRVEWWASDNLLERMIELTRAGLAGAVPDLGSSGSIEVPATDAGVDEAAST